jgi:putative solute:sodium symporter small subunit
VLANLLCIFIATTSNLPMNIKKDKASAYWKENIKYVLILLSIWFMVSYGAGIIFKEYLDQFHIGGFKLGFWFAQQGAIYVFVVLIFVYIYLMNRLDKKYGYDNDSKNNTL